MIPVTEFNKAREDCDRLHESAPGTFGGSQRSNATRAESIRDALQGIAQWRTEFGQLDLERIAVLDANTIRETQCRRAKEV